MILDQFDKLKDLTRRLTDRTLELKQENYRLKQGKKSSTGMHSDGSPYDESEYKAAYIKLLDENKKLKEKNRKAQDYLTRLIQNVEAKMQNY